MNKKNTLTAAVLLAALIFTKIMLRPFGGLDELWVYGIARGISMGYVPYRDFSMVMMPLFTVLFSLPLYIVRNLFVYRIMSALMLFGLGFTYYRIASRMTDHLWGLLASLLLTAFMDFATYNGLMVLLTLLAFILFRDLTVRGAAAAGVLCGLAVLCRQTSGVFLIVAVVILMCTDKTLRKFILPFLIGWGAVMAVFAVCLLATDSFSAFWDCCFFALTGNGEKNSGILADGIAVDILVVAGVIASGYLVKKNAEREDKLHLIFGIILISIGIPTVDMMHMLYAAAWFLIPLFKLMRKSVSAPLLKIIIAAMSAAVLFLNVCQLPGKTLDNRYKEFALIPVKTSELDYYGQIIAINTKYEDEGRRVVMLTSGRCIVSMMTDSFDPDYDLFLKGNTGTRTPVSYIENELASDNVIFVIPDDYEEENWQNPSGVLEFVQTNCEPVERYDAFVWYVPSSGSV